MRSIRWLLVAAVPVVGLLWWLFLAPHGLQLGSGPQEGIYVAGSTIPDKEALGGFGDWDNYPKNLAGETWGEAGAVSLIAFPQDRAQWRNLRGFALRLVNRTDKPVAFTACDSRLYLVQEAVDRNGQWRAIETDPESGCGNSFHRVFLDKNQYWEFPAKRYTGLFKTKIRFRLEQGEEHFEDLPVGAGEDKRRYCFPTRGGKIIYSNEFEGHVSPSQFVDPQPDE